MLSGVHLMPWVAFTVWCTPVGQGYLLIRLSFHVYSPGLLDPLSSLECVSQRTGWSTDHGTFDTGLPPLGEGCDPHQLLEENPPPPSMRLLTALTGIGVGGWGGARRG